MTPKEITRKTKKQFTEAEEWIRKLNHLSFVSIEDIREIQSNSMREAAKIVYSIAVQSNIKEAHVLVETSYKLHQVALAIEQGEYKS